LTLEKVRAPRLGGCVFPFNRRDILDLDRAAHDRGGPGEGEVDQASAVRERANAGRVTAAHDLAGDAGARLAVRSRLHDDGRDGARLACRPRRLRGA